MSIPPPLRKGLIACVLLSAALSSAALTLGRSRGVALVGRTLDVTIPLTLDSPGQAGDLCADADVFHGDTRVDAARVTARIESGTGQNAVVRVRSSLPVDEPVVTIYLRLGCGQKVTRRYVLLAEEPGELSGPAFTTPAPAALPLPSAAPAVQPARPATPAAPAPGQAAPVGAAPEPPPARSRPQGLPPAARTAPAARAETALAARPTRSPAARAARSPRPRLSLDLLDPGAGRDPQLRPSAALAGAPSTDEQVRAQAAALWRSINAQPEDVLRDLQRVQALENDVKGLRTLVAGNDRTLAELRGQLAQSRQERSLTLAAIALLTLLLAALVVAWWLRRGERAGGREWWRRRDAAADAAAGAEPPRPGPSGAPAGRAAERDLRVDESMFESLKKVPRVPVVPLPVPSAATPPPVAPRARAAAEDSTAGPVSTFQSSFQSGFLASQISSMRMVKAEELVDIQQQADFFLSLGQTEQAIEVLESHIHNNAETSALVWLDLLAIYRSLKRRQDYELLRSDFQRVFNAQVPAYDSTPTVSGGLEDYPRALTRIAALWPSPKVMDVIEESIFRKPGTADAEPFDLEAYRELVMLYNLGREVVQPEPVAPQDWSTSQQGRSGFSETSMQPLSLARDTLPPGPADLHLDRIDSDIETGLGSVLDSGPAETALSEMVDLDSLIDSTVDPRDEPRTTASEFRDPQVPRPSPRLGLDIDLTAVPPGDRKPPVDSNSIDFELSEPEAGDTDSDAGPSRRG